MSHWLDAYINKKKLEEKDYNDIHSSPLKWFAYKKSGNKDYQSIKCGLGMLQRVYYSGYRSDDVSYIIDKTGLNFVQKVWLKFLYAFTVIK